MSFIALKLLEACLCPSTIILAAAIAGFLLRRSRHASAGTVLLAASLAVQAVIFVFPVDIWVLAPLEDRIPRLIQPPARVTGIVVLGGAVNQVTTEARGIPSLNGAAERMTDFVARARQYPDAILAFTGGSGRIVNGSLTEADVARALFDQLGLDRPITYESRSRTTHENAIDLARILHPQPGQTWLLITSADHMPRALAEFRAAGWPVVPDPVAYKTAHSFAASVSGGFPDRLSRIDEAAHEWLGLAATHLFVHPAPLASPGLPARP